MKVGLLTSSRADYGIYKPLIKALKEDDFFQLKIIVFGTHLSPFHGKTVKDIYADHNEVAYEVNSLLVGDNPNAIATSCALTNLKFAEFWETYKGEFDLVLCLGDRFEMYAAVSSAIPYGIKFAHLYGGETTLGAIDNVYRHMITLASELHFVSLEAYAGRVAEIIGNHNKIYTVGSLSLDNLAEIELLNIEDFYAKWGIDLNEPTVLITIHPETVSPLLNGGYLKEVLQVFEYLEKNYQLVITMPNADTYGSLFRRGFENFAKEKREKVKLIENFGSQSYFTCMLNAKFLLGNTSSGITEAASFRKYVINLGKRQEGRYAGKNVINVPFDFFKISKAIKTIEAVGEYSGGNPYYQGGAVNKILQILKAY
jgi:GDP/UDP-N,N'-diacetylbacillosamine 2-epimerase (hydrolysing)